MHSPVTLVFCTVMIFGQMFTIVSGCEDMDICTHVFGNEPVNKISQCYDHSTFNTCCKTCENLRGRLAHPDEDCSWGNEGRGATVDGTTFRMCESLLPEECATLCAPHLIFKQNCCQTCFDTCGTNK